MLRWRRSRAALPAVACCGRHYWGALGWTQELAGPCDCLPGHGLVAKFYRYMGGGGVRGQEKKFVYLKFRAPLIHFFFFSGKIF